MLRAVVPRAVRGALARTSERSWGASSASSRGVFVGRAAASGSVDGDADDRGSEASATDDSLSEHDDVAEGGSALPSALEVRVWPLEARQFPRLRVQAMTNPALARAACCE